MNEQYKETIEIEGRVYRYDPDFDCYYRSHNQPPETAQERWTKVAIAIVLLMQKLIIYFYLLAHFLV